MRNPLLLFFLGLLAGAICSARAVLPPSAYEQMQATAPAVVEIEVLKVQREPAETTHDELVHVTAVALKIERSAPGLVAGDFLRIIYRVPVREDGRMPRDQVPLLQEGQRTVAFLRPVEGKPYWAPAAGAMSFSRF